MLGITPFYSAPSTGHVEVCQLLVSNRADIGARDTSNKTSLHRAARLGDQGLEVCCLLIFEGAYLEAKDKEGRTPLHAGASVSTTRLGLEVCKLLLSKGADINAKDKSQTTPLHVTAYTGHTDIVHLFLHQEDVEADARDDQGKSPAYVAAERCNLEALRLMHASQKVDMRIRAPLEGMTILYVACKSSMAMVEYLVGQGLGDMADEECIWCLFQNLQGLTRKGSRNNLGKTMRTLLMPGEIVLSEVNRLKEVLVNPNHGSLPCWSWIIRGGRSRNQIGRVSYHWRCSTHLLSRGVGDGVDEFARRLEDSRSSTIVDG